MTSVPEWTRCHGITVPDEDVLFQAAGGTVEIWRQIFERVSQMRVRQLHFDHYLFYLISFRPKGFESLGRLSNCLLRDFFILPVVFLLLGLMQLKNKMSASGFTLVGALSPHPSPPNHQNSRVGLLPVDSLPLQASSPSLFSRTRRLLPTRSSPVVDGSDSTVYPPNTACARPPALTRGVQCDA